MPGAYTVRPEGIIRQPALTMPGNATGSEAACTALTGSQIRAICGLGTTDNAVFGSVASSGLVSAVSPSQFTSGFIAKGPAIDLNWGGGINFTSNTGTVHGYIRADNTTLYQTATQFSGHVTFNATNTYDIGDGTYDPRTVRAATSVLTPLLNNTNAAALILGNSTYGISVPGAATFSGDISMSKTSAQGYLNLYSPDGTKLLYLYANNTGTGAMVATTSIQMSSASGSVSVTNNQIALWPTSGNAYVFVPGTNSTFDVYDGGGTKYSRLTHDGTNGILSTSSGDVVLSPASNASWCNGTVLYVWKSGSQSSVRAYDSSGTKYIQITHDATNGTVGTTHGNLNLTPNSGTTSVTGALTSTTTITANKFVCSNTSFPYTSVDHASGIYLDRVAVGYGLLREADIISFRGIGGGSAIVKVVGTTYFYNSLETASLAVTATSLTSTGRITMTGNSDIYLSPTGGSTVLYTASVNSVFDVYAGTGLDRVRTTHNGTAGTISTNTGNLNLTPAGGTVAVTGSITASGAIQETYRTSSLDPTVSDIGSGKRQGWYNTSSLEFRDWVNVSGTLLKSAAYT